MLIVSCLFITVLEIDIIYIQNHKPFTEFFSSVTIEIMLATNVHLNVIISYTNDFATYQYVQDLYKKIQL